MREVTDQTKAAWLSPAKTGPNRPRLRATIEWGRVHTTPYQTSNMLGGEFEQRDRQGRFRAINFYNQGVRELRNLRSISWSRSVDQDVAEATLTIRNTEVVPIGTDRVNLAGDFELPGLFTFSRGKQPNRWGYDRDEGWQDQIVPDRLIRTYEGYGWDETVPPNLDEHMYPSGVWMVDDVEYNANGDIELKMRDLGRMLLDHMVFPPVVPRDDYPLEWSKVRREKVDGREAKGGKWEQPRGVCSSSNDAYVGKGIADNPRYVNARGGVQGHYPRHAYRAKDEEGAPKLYWLSTGQEGRRDKVWWQVDFNKKTALAAIKMFPCGGPFIFYVSVGNDERWYGKKKIPYEPGTEDIDNGARIPYVKTFWSERRAMFEVPLPQAYGDVTRVRITITRLRDIWPASTYPFRAGLRQVKFYVAPSKSDLSFVDGKVMRPVGNYRDFSQIPQWIGAWGGFYWPRKAWQRSEEGGDKMMFPHPSDKGALPKGRTWGHFQRTHTAGKADLTADLFDKQPLMDVISHIRENTGFMFGIDEVGGMIWRLPNLFEFGNWVAPHHHHPSRWPTRTDKVSDVVVIDEHETLLDYSVTLSSRNLRERVFIADTSGRHGVVIKGFRPNPTGLMRVAGWTDSNFRGNREAQVAAELIAARQMFDFRRSRSRIPANPAIQVDDQVQFLERVTNETYYHYVVGISCELNVDDGTWTYDLETHWLGSHPEQEWGVTTKRLSKVTKSYIKTLGGFE